ncbi:MAG: hypothetical protein HYS81_04850 [Candidatus Aenigmatarchaeota archaeon]|nr:MAG: hypothetical protein HYS81_04850 [Candidatus Aenigmarchaeota archaeon]
MAKVRTTYSLNVETVAKLREAATISKQPMSRLVETSVLEMSKQIIRANGNAPKKTGEESPVSPQALSLIRQLLFRTGVLR